MSKISFVTILIYIFTFFIPFRTDYFISSLNATLSLPFLLSFPLLFILFYKLLSTNTMRVPLFKYWLFFTSIVALSAFLGSNITSVMHGAWVSYQNAIVPIIIFPIICVFLKTKRRVENTIKVIVVSASIGALIGILQTASSGENFSGFVTNSRYLGFLYELSPKAMEERLMDYGASKSLLLIGTNIYRAHGTMYSHNHFGVILSVSIFLTLGLLLSEYKSQRKIAWLMLLIIQLSCLIATFSRGAWVAVSFGFYVFLFLIIKRTKLHEIFNIKFIFAITLLLFPVFIALISSLYFSSVYERMASITNPLENPDVISRFAIWYVAFKEGIKRPILGHGCHGISHVLPNQPFDLSAHNLFFDVFYRHGIIVTLMLIFFIFKHIQYNRYSLKLARSHSDIMITFGMLSALAGYLVASMGTGSFSNYCTSSLFWLMFGLSVAWRKQVYDSVIKN